MVPIYRTLLLATLVSVPCAQALAEPIERSGAFERCAAIADNTKRLECFDALSRPDGPPAIADAAEEPQATDGDLIADTAPAEAAAVSPPAPPSDDFVVLPRAEAEALRRKAEDAEREEKREPYESEIVRVFITGYNVVNVVLANGETWRHLAKTAGRKPRAGENARLAPASLGSWTIRYGDRSARTKVKRVR